MRTMILVFSVVFILSLVAEGQEQSSEYEAPLNVFVFSKTSGYRHESISSGLKMLYDLSHKENWLITATEDASFFNDQTLSKFDVAVFLNPTGDGLTDAQQMSFRRWMESGKGLVGMHAAADFEFEWPYYGKLLGAWFKTHPPAQKATVIFENTDHPAMKPFKGMKSYTTFDEWYSFRDNPRKDVNVLARLDESSLKKYKNDDWKMGDHPVIWWKDNNGVRSFYTVFGHTHEAFGDEKIIEHIKNAVNWAGKRVN
jgi:uncharacterized protein